MKTTKQQPDKHYSVNMVHGAQAGDKNAWVVGKANSLTRLYYFDTFGQAIAKLVELEGPEFIVRAVNNRDYSLTVLKDCLDYVRNHNKATPEEMEAIILKAIAQMEGK